MEEFNSLRERMMEIAQSMPGFISYKVYSNEDGERVSIHEWESKEALQAWREHPEHIAAQKQGRADYYSNYTVYVMENPRESRYEHGA
ncbi:MAG: antibiotic biosynthesis monooxygenase [Thiotrichales bacterium]|nr:antibiotic biosynthesis monooxygenase [Thiotrichales bacterium]